MHTKRYTDNLYVSFPPRFISCFFTCISSGALSIFIPVLQVYELVDQALPCPWPADLSVMMDFEL